MIQSILRRLRYQAETNKIERALRLSITVSVLVGLLACAKPAPAPEPIPDVPPAPPPPFEHRVQYSGETLGLIARWYTGKSTNWEAIQAANPGLDPRRMNLGMLITIPRDLLVKEEPMPRSFVGAMPATSAKVDTSSTTTAEPESDDEDTVDSTTKADAPSELSAEEKLRRDLEAALAAEMNGSEAEASVPKTAEAAPKAVETGAVEAVGTADVPDTSAEEVDRERLLDELLAE